MTEGLAPGSRLGHYDIVAMLGVGGMGEVYLANDLRLDRQVAIKVIASEVADNPDRLRRFVREARTASSLNHPNIAHVYEIGESEGRQFIAMEYIRGELLSRRIGGKPMPIADVIVFATQIADALDEAHAHGVIHRDLKPANAIISTRGRLKILDFGLAKIVDDEDIAVPRVSTQTVDTAVGMVFGTLDYMSPEQVRGFAVDRRSDIFSFGTMVYEMITGRVPFAGASKTDTIFRITQAQPDAITRFAYDVPEDLDRIVRKCLEKSPEQRYQSVRELLVDLSKLRRDGSSGLSGSVPGHTIGRHGKLWATGIAAVVAAVAIAGTWWLQRTHLIESIAVIPDPTLAAHSQDADLSQGVAAALINSLSLQPGLKVAPRLLSFARDAGGADPIALAKRLGVDGALIVSVVAKGESAVVDLQLVDIDQVVQSWSYYETKPLAEIQLAQERLSREIAEQLQLRLSPMDQRAQEVYELYQRGRYHASRRTEPEIRRAIADYEQAISKDRNYALAYAGLAEAFNLLTIYSGMGERDAFQNAKRSAERALVLDPTLAEARAQLAWVLFRSDWDWEGAEREFTSSIELNASIPEARHFMAVYFCAMGRFDEALARIREARDIDPLSPTFAAEVVRALHLADRNDEALAEGRKVVERFPTSLLAHRFLALVLEQLGRHSEAIDAFHKALSIDGGTSTLLRADLGHAYARAGNRAEATRIFSELFSGQNRAYVSPYNFAVLSAGLGDVDGALKWLEIAMQNKANSLVWLKVDPRFDSMRRDPRFVKLLAQLRMP